MVVQALPENSPEWAPECVWPRRPWVPMVLFQWGSQSQGLHHPSSLGLKVLPGSLFHGPDRLQSHSDWGIVGSINIYWLTERFQGFSGLDHISLDDSGGLEGHC